jgi:hypothetical protein
MSPVEFKFTPAVMLADGIGAGIGLRFQHDWSSCMVLSDWRGQ